MCFATYTSFVIVKAERSDCLGEERHGLVGVKNLFFVFTCLRHEVYMVFPMRPDVHFDDYNKDIIL